MLATLGRITGISGIVGSLPTVAATDRAWRFAFIGGLLAGGALLLAASPAVFGTGEPQSVFRLVAAGLLVGFGTRIGSGCTSGHGVCGISRMSRRSIVATCTFMAIGMLIVALFGGAA